jgi:hypothetical protein
MLKAYARGFLLVIAGTLLSINFYAKSTAFADPPRIKFALGPAAVDLENSKMALIAVNLKNTSGKTAYKVEILSIKLVSGKVTKPAHFPFPVGDIGAGDHVVLQTAFTARTVFSPGQSSILLVRGRYHPTAKGFELDPEDPEDFDFTVRTRIVFPPAAPGSANLHTGTVNSNSVSGGTFPPVLAPGKADEGSKDGPPVPNGPFVPGVPTATQSLAIPDPGDPAVDFLANDLLGLISGGFTGQAGNPAEPSGGANGGGIIFASANWTAAYSTNGGTSFTQLNPTTIFPADAVGFCCDQIVQFVPGIGTGGEGRFIWLLQGTGYRLASASPASVKSSGGTAWTYWNLAPGFFGVTGGLDYPDLAVGNNYLYLSFQNVGTGQMVARISLAQIAAGGTITVEWTDPKDGSMARLDHVTQDTGDEVFWAGHLKDSKLRVFSLKEGDGKYFWRDVQLSSWANNSPASNTPDGQNWLATSPSSCCHAVLGATRAPGPSGAPGELFSDGIWFAWAAGTDSNFPQPHIEMVTLDRSNNFSVVQQVQIWNSDFAFSQPALATNACTHEVGLSLEYGGNNKFYENHVVGFWGDFVVYITTNSDVGTTQFGDYVTIRQDYDPSLNGAYFDAFGYGLNNPPAGKTGTQTDIRYVLFGRKGACVPTPIK